MNVFGQLLNPELIRVASKSFLGILALMIVVAGMLAALFFRHAPVGVRVTIFILMFGGVVAFGVAVVREGDGPPQTPTASPILFPTTTTRTRPAPEPTIDWK